MGRRVVFVIAILLFPFAVRAAPQGTAPITQPTSLEIYANAMKQPRVADQIAELERYLTVAENGILKHDALEVLTWDYMRMSSAEHVKQRAQQLLAMDPGNPVALAALAEEGVIQPGGAPAAPSPRYGHEQHGHEKDARNQRIASAQSALVALEQLRRPEGMQAGDFAAMRRRVESRLNGLLGLAYVDREEYQQARTPLQQAVAVDPANPQYAYALGLALLMGKDPADQQNAFLYLARAVNLTRGTPSGTEIADFAHKQYRKAGGKDADWNGYLAAAVVPETRRSQPAMNASATPPAPTINTATSTPPRNTAPPSGAPPATSAAPLTSAAPATSTAPATSAAPATSTAPATSAAPATSTAPATSATPATGTAPSTGTVAAARPNVSPANPPTSAATNSNAPGNVRTSPGGLPATASTPAPSTTERAAVTPPDVNVRPAPTPRPIQPVVSTPNAPLTLGILIETALLTHQNRDAIIATLKDLISHLRAEDEAAILVFSNQLDFEQDLTADDNLLEQAMSSLQPRTGRALLDGVAFAAGHLRRIGKNPNRVLLVISDGRTGRETGQPISAEVQGVRIYCIGLNADGEEQRQLLQRLASYTGGVATFASGPQEFRMATTRFTQDMGLAFR
jgi:tetratricopeptide (TPR) repeat protein